MSSTINNGKDYTIINLDYGMKRKKQNRDVCIEAMGHFITWNKLDLFDFFRISNS